MESTTDPELPEFERPDLDARATEFYDAAYFARQCVNSRAAFRRYYYLVRPFVDDGESVLDFGCGVGDLLHELPAKVKMGIEINPASRSFAQQRGLDVRASVADLEGLMFSRIISAHVLEHVVLPARTLSRLKDLLAPGGLLLLVLPLDDWRNASQRQWRPNDQHMHLYTWTPNTIGNLLSISSFEPLRIEIVNRTHPPKVGHKLWQLNPTVYSAAAWLSSLIFLRRQIFVVAQKKGL
jgi:SAM-dependent methyltransferase